MLHCEQAVPPESTEVEAALPDEVKHAHPEDPGETRCYHFSPLSLQQEQELLEEYKVEDFRGLLFEAHLPLSGMVELMKNIELETSINSSAIYSLGCLLERISSLIFKMQDAYSTLERVKE